MKSTILLLMMFISTSVFAQNEFKFEKTGEVNKTKNQIYSDTKMFIADRWKSSKAVMENDDKDGGIIQLKGKSFFKYGVGMGLSCEYTYDYTVRFRQRDNKYRIEIYDITCTEAKQTGLGATHDVPLIQPFEGEPTENTKSAGKGLSKKKAKEMMGDLEADMNQIISLYEKHIIIEDDF